jgi:hypothetical protein
VPANTADVTLLLPVVKRLRGLFVLRTSTKIAALQVVLR